jgi:hypothetical protein
VNTSETDWVIVLNAHDLGVNFSDDMSPRNRRANASGSYENTLRTVRKQ